MKFAALAILLFCGPVFSQVKTPSLFEVSGPAGPSYVLGTIHGRVGLSEFPVDIARLVRGSRLLMVEISLTDEEIGRYPRDPFSVIEAHSPFSGGGLDPATGLKLQRLGMPRSFVTRLSDGDCGVLGVLDVLGSPVLPLDIELMRLARERGLPVTALDTAELRIEARRRNNAAEGTCSLKALFDAYSPEQIQRAIADSIAADAAEYRSGRPIAPEVLDRPIVVFRNLAWLPAIEAELQKGGAFIGVGDAHLYGNQGLLELLRRRGWTVKRVQP